MTVNYFTWNIPLNEISYLMAYIRYSPSYQEAVILLKDYGRTTVQFLVITDTLLEQMDVPTRERVIAETYYTDYINRARFIRDDSSLASWLMLKYNNIRTVDAVFTLDP